MDITEEVKGYLVGIMGFIPIFAVALYMIFDARKDIKELDEYNQQQNSA